MHKTTVEYKVNCKRCGIPIGYSGMMYEKMSAYGQSRPEYCEVCRKELLLEKMTMGAAYFSVKTLPGEDLTIALPGELGMVYHPQRPHVRHEEASKFDASKFGATPDKIVDIYKWLKDKNHQVAIVIGETGSGKSTALPYWLIYPPKGVPEDFFTRDGQILITQPRIVATTSIAEYMGVLLGSSVGKGFDIGYRYSKDRNNDRFNAAVLATDGSLINMIMKGQLADFSVIMIDEAHERSDRIDIILRLLKDQLPLYPHLKLLIVSATINKESFLKYFGEDTAKVIEFEAKRKFDYAKYFADEGKKLPYENPSKLRGLLVPALVEKVMWLLNEQVAGRKIKANTLAFLHGVKPIEEAVAELKRQIAVSPTLKDKVEVYPLYSDLDEKVKDLALKGSGSGKIRVIVSTNVAEASITVEGIVYVVESGVENQANWKSETLETKVGLTLISQANAKQRWGRSGRTAPGEVYCLYTEEQFQSMLPFPIPAIQRTSMEEIVLLLKKLGVDDLEGGWIDGPDTAELSRSMTSLHKSGAVDEDEMLTEYGILLNDFAYTASLTDLIIAADRFGCAVEVATLLPVIKNGGHKRLLTQKDEWDRKERQTASLAHQFLWKNCKDDVEFILKLYSQWSNPPDRKSGKRMNLPERRKAWTEEFYVNNDVLEEIEAERNQILSLLNGHKKDRNFRQINFRLVDRTRVILAYCVPFKEVTETYAYRSLSAESGTSANYQMALPPKKKKVVDDNLAKTRSLFSLARDLMEVEKNDPADDVFARLFKDADLSLEEVIKLVEEEQKDKITKTYAVGQILEATVTGFADFGTFVKLPLGNSGMIHISKMGKRVEKPSDMLAIGDLVQVEVLEMREEKEKVRIGLRLKSILKKA